MTYADLEKTARKTAAILQDRNITGPAVILCSTNSPQFAGAFYGCIFAGVPAVPTRSPSSKRHVSTVLQLIEHSGASAVLADGVVTRRLHQLFIQQSSKELVWIDVDATGEVSWDAWKDPCAKPSTTSHLQFTSGSTALPRAVVVSHGNVLANVLHIDRDFQHSTESTSVSWLPHFHDMGLIYGILAPALLKFHAVLLRPSDFVRQPMSWLTAISQFRATHSGAPNFAFDACVRSASGEKPDQLNLNTWRIAFLGAEMIRASTLELFAKTFEPYGFDRKSYYPAYGLAEATLKVCGRFCRQSDPVQRFSKAALLQGVVFSEPGEQKDHITLVSCGSPKDSTRVEIVNPDSLSKCEPGLVGEIWVAGPGVAGGYFRSEDESISAFRAETHDRQGPFLRTGDMGFLLGGELFVTGRRKEIIIIRGMNFSPAQLESCVADSHVLLGNGAVVAFSIDRHGIEQLVVIIEVKRHVRSDAYDESLRAADDALAREHGVRASVLALVREGGIPRTSSGKIQRLSAKDLYLSGGLELLREERAFTLKTDGAQNMSGPPPDCKTIIPELVAKLSERVDARWDWEGLSELPLPGVLLDSLEAAQLQTAIEQRFRVRVPISELLSIRSISALAKIIRDQMLFQSTKEGADCAFPYFDTTKCTPDEQRLWALNEIHRNCPAHRIVFAIAIDGALDQTVLATAFELLFRRCPELASSFSYDQGRICKNLKAFQAPTFHMVENGGASLSVVRRRAALLCGLPVDLEHGRLTHAELIRAGSGKHWLIIAVHHIAIDALSAELLVQRLADLYRAVKEGLTTTCPSSPSHPTACRTWHGEDLEFWRNHLANATDSVFGASVSALNFTTGTRASEVDLTLASHVSRKLQTACEYHQVTPFMLLLACFAETLHAWAHISDATVMTAISHRPTPQTLNAIGLFAHPLVINLQGVRARSFGETLKRVKTLVTDLLSFGHVPFNEIVRVMRPSRRFHKQPYMDVMFNFIRRQTPSIIEASDTQWTLLPLSNGSAENLLNLTVVQSYEGLLIINVKYADQVFSERKMKDLLTSYTDILSSNCDMDVSKPVIISSCQPVGEH